MITRKLKLMTSAAAFGLAAIPTILLAATTVAGIDNPLKSENLTALLADILNIVVEIGIPIVTIMIIMAGFKYVTAGGDSGKVQDAHEMFLWTVVGAAIVLGAFVIVNIIQTTVNAIRG